jgi:uncharacterized protein YciI
MLFAVKLFDRDDPGGALRDANRQAHLDYLETFEDSTLFAGPILSEDRTRELGSHRLIDLADRAAAEAHVAGEPYVLGGLQYGPEIHPWSASVPHSWRDCPRTEGNAQFLIHAIDKPGSEALRDRLRAEHEAYQASVEHLYMTRGPLLSGDGTRQIGSLMIIDVTDLAAAKAFWEGEPFNTGGLFETVEFCGWRFGRVFDRFNRPNQPN